MKLLLRCSLLTAALLMLGCPKRGPAAPPAPSAPATTPLLLAQSLIAQFADPDRQEAPFRALFTEQAWGEPGGPGEAFEYLRGKSMRAELDTTDDDDGMLIDEAAGRAVLGLFLTMDDGEPGPTYFFYAVRGGDGLWRVAAQDTSEAHLWGFMEGVLPASMEELPRDQDLDRIGGELLAAALSPDPVEGAPMLFGSAGAIEDLRSVQASSLLRSYLLDALDRGALCYDNAAEDDPFCLYLERREGTWAVIDRAPDGLFPQLLLRGTELER